MFIEILLPSKNPTKTLSIIFHHFDRKKSLYYTFSVMCYVRFKCPKFDIFNRNLIHCNATLVSRACTCTHRHTPLLRQNYFVALQRSLMIYFGWLFSDFLHAKRLFVLKVAHYRMTLT